MPLNSLCALNKTCKSLRNATKEYFRCNYPTQEFEIGDEFVFEEQQVECFGRDVPALCIYDSSIEDFLFAGSNINRNLINKDVPLREIIFEQTYELENQISNAHIDAIGSILENVKTVHAIDCDFEEGCLEYLLDKCTNIKDLSIKACKDLSIFKLQFEKYLTLRNILIQIHSKTNAEHAMRLLSQQNLQLDELVLSFGKEHQHHLDSVFKELNIMQKKSFFKRLYLSFDKKSMSDHINKLVSIECLEGVLCGYTIGSSIDNHIEDIARLQQLKYLNINRLLENADLIAVNLQELQEVEISVASIDTINSFVRHSAKLAKLHIEQIRSNEGTSVKFDAFTLNRRRSMLVYARKLDIYVPEKNFIKLKWSSVTMKSDLVEIKREESCRPKRE